MYDARKLVEAAQNNLTSAMPRETVALVYALCSIGAALDEISRSFDLSGIEDGVKQAAVELGQLSITIEQK